MGRALPGLAEGFANLAHPTKLLSKCSEQRLEAAGYSRGSKTGHLNGVTGNGSSGVWTKRVKKLIQKWTLASCYRRGSREGRCRSTHVAGERATASQAQGCLTPKGGSSYYMATSWTKVRGCSRRKEPGPRCVCPPASAHSPLVSSWIPLRTPRLLHLLGWSLSGTNLYKVGRQGSILPP